MEELNATLKKRDEQIFTTTHNDNVGMLGNINAHRDPLQMQMQQNVNEEAPAEEVIEPATVEEADARLLSHIQGLDKTWGFFGDSREMKLVKREYGLLQEALRMENPDSPKVKIRQAHLLLRVIRVCEDYRDAKIKDPAHDTSARHRYVLQIRESAQRCLKIRTENTKDMSLTDQDLRYSHNKTVPSMIDYLSANSSTGGEIVNRYRAYVEKLKQPMPNDQEGFTNAKQELLESLRSCLGECQNYSRDKSPITKGGRRKLAHVREIRDLLKDESELITALDFEKIKSEAKAFPSFEAAMLKGIARISLGKDKEGNQHYNTDDGRTRVQYVEKEAGQKYRQASQLADALGLQRGLFAHMEDVYLENANGDLKRGYIREKNVTGTWYTMAEILNSAYGNNVAADALNVRYSEDAQKDLAAIQIMDILGGKTQRAQQSIRYQAEIKNIDGEQVIYIAHAQAYNNLDYFPEIKPEEEQKEEKQTGENKNANIAHAAEKNKNANAAQETGKDRHSIIHQVFQSALNADGAIPVISLLDDNFKQMLVNAKADTLIAAIDKSGQTLSEDQKKLFEDRLTAIQNAIKEADKADKDKKSQAGSAYMIKEFHELKYVEGKYEGNQIFKAEQERRGNKKIISANEYGRRITKIKNTLAKIRDERHKLSDSESRREERKTEIRNAAQECIATTEDQETKEILENFIKYSKIKLTIYKLVRAKESKDGKYWYKYHDQKPFTEEAKLLSDTVSKAENRIKDLSVDSKEYRALKKCIDLSKATMKVKGPSDKFPEMKETAENSIVRRDNKFIDFERVTDENNQPKIQLNPITFRDRKNEPLFPHEPNIEDVGQGLVGDCFAMATIAGLVDADPDAIRDMFRDNGNGTVTVRLYRAPDDPIYVTVEKTVPEKVVGEGDVEGDEKTDVYARGALWVQMIEKAYAASGLHEVFKKDDVGIGDLVKDQSVVSYKSISGGGSRDFAKVLTGKEGEKTEIVSCRNQVTGLKKAGINTGSDGMTRLVRKLRAGLKKSGVAIMASTKDIKNMDEELGLNGENMMHGIAGNHVYTVLGIEDFDDGRPRIKIRNPWGTGAAEETYNEITGASSLRRSQYANDIGTFFVPVDIFAEIFDDFTEVSLNKKA